MPRKNSCIREHEKETAGLRSQGMTLRQIGEKPGFTHASGLPDVQIFGGPGAGTTPIPTI